MYRKILSALLVLLVTGCALKTEEPKIKGRWFTQSEVNSGKRVFQQNCSTCHGKNAGGTSDWKKPSPDGVYPPPPLNGTAHTWHHSLNALKRIVNNGGIPLGGKMPGFKEKLDEKEIDAVISYFQNFWDDEIYRSWVNRGGLKRDR